MADDSLRGLIDSVRTRVQAELEAQLIAVAQGHEAALATLRQRLTAEADQRAASEQARFKSEAQQTIEAAVMAARADVEERVAAEITRHRIDAERELNEQRNRLRAESDARIAAAASASLQRGTIVPAVRAIESARTLSDMLTTIAAAAANRVPQSMLLIARGEELKPWNPAAAWSDVGEVAALAGEALTTRSVIRNDGTAIAVPLLLDGSAVGVLYGEAPGTGVEFTGWAEALETLASCGAASLGYLTAVRTAQAREWLGGERAPVAPGTSTPSSARATTPSDSAGTPAAAAPANEEEAQAARRYARLLVSEVKLYNEAAVREGRARRDLLRRLAPEVDRARRLYEERVASSVPGRAQHFQQELVQTLAGGDPSLLG